MDTINPLMSFSSEDIANMDREVEDIFNESESDGEADRPAPQQEEAGESQTRNVESADESSSSSAESLSGKQSSGKRLPMIRLFSQ
jgi:RNA polymerase II subunit A-like phosphatase